MIRLLRQVIERHAGWVLMFVFAASLLAVAFYTLRQERLLVEASALDAARLYSQALSEFRAVYTSEVVDRLRDADVDVLSDYALHPGAVPLPATLTILLGARIGEAYQGASVQLFSPYPFPRRASPGGLRDDFSREAWSTLSEEGQEVFYQFEVIDGSQYLRYATADRMQAACVTCHNNHEETPRADWSVGDLRGVLEVRYPLDQVLALQQESERSGLILLATVFLLGAIGIGTVVYVFGRRQKLLDLLVERRTRQLAASESQIRSVVASIVESVIVIDREGHIQSANGAAEEMFGYPESELLGENVSRLMPSPYREEHDGYLTNFLETGVGKIIGVGGRRLVGLRRDGTVFDMELAVSESRVGDDVAFTGIVRDISQQLTYERKLEELSVRDSLTGLANRRAFDRVLDREWRRCLRGHDSLAIVLVDIDYFKQYNDRYGHLAGDECLKRVASVMAQQVHRPGDVIARFGGEEFIVVLPEADGAGAVAVAEHVRRAVMDLDILQERDEGTGCVTVSAGVASAIPSSDDPTELINQADMALYRAKEAGRNQVQLAS